MAPKWLPGGLWAALGGSWTALKGSKKGPPLESLRGLLGAAQTAPKIHLGGLGTPLDGSISASWRLPGKVPEGV